MGKIIVVLQEEFAMSQNELKEDEEGIFDGCFYVWVDVTKKYLNGTNGRKFNDYEKIRKGD